MVDQVGAGPTGPAPVLPGALRTARLTLLPLRVEHAEEMAVVLADPALHAFTGDAPLPVAELRARYQRQVAGSPDPAEAWGNWVIRLDAEGALTGYVQATATADQAEIAWVVGTPGSGVASPRRPPRAWWPRSPGPCSPTSTRTTAPPKRSPPQPASPPPNSGRTANAAGS